MKRTLLLLSMLSLAAASLAQGIGETWVKPYTDRKGHYHEGHWRRDPRSIPMSEKEYVPGHVTKSGKFVPGGYRTKSKRKY